jgi:hypothetical protein
MIDATGHTALPEEFPMSSATAHCERIITLIDDCLADYEEVLLGLSRPVDRGAITRADPRISADLRPPRRRPPRPRQ